MNISTSNENSSECLTKYPIASLRELIYISSFLILALFSGSFMGFCDRLFLSHYSLEALEACVSTNSLIMLFQIPSIVIASIAQVFVGRYKGFGKQTYMGKSVWQMIWWSFASSIFILPLGLLFEHFYFQGTSLAHLGKMYFHPLIFFNFLFPLGAALSSFYIGQGKTKCVLFITLGAHFINILLNPIFIFGVKGFFPSLGILGAAIASVIAQASYCLFFFILFLQKKNRTTYGTIEYCYNHDIFFEGIKIGIPNALSRMLALLTWAAATKIILHKGGDYLLVLSIGSSFHLLFTFLNEGIHQGIIPIAAFLIGRNKQKEIWKLMRSSYLLLGLFFIFLSIPCLIFSEKSIFFFLKESISLEQLKLLKQTCFWLWIYFFGYGCGRIGAGFLVAAKDTIFLFIFNAASSWLLTYAFVLFIVQIFACSPDKLWLTMAISSFICGIAYFFRIKKKNAFTYTETKS